MKRISQLRVRTEFSFRDAFGPIARVAAALKELDAPAAGIVDKGTWGAVKWAAALEKVGIAPLFGTELVVPAPDGRRPISWALAGEDSRAFYRFSTAARLPDADIPALFAEAKGKVIRFAGAGLTNPEQFDYIDLNPASPLQQIAALKLHKTTKKPLVITSDNLYPRLSDKSIFQAMGGRERVTPQHILNEAELRASFKMLDEGQFKRALLNNEAVVERCCKKLPTAPLIKVEGDLRKVVEAGRKRRLKLGHLSEWNKVYADRLKREIQAIEEKEYESYFLVVADLVRYAKTQMLVGPGRGSSAGSLLCYLVGITEVDPIPHDLLFERFIDLTRKDLPDIDIDFNDQKRDLVFKYLEDKYGKANVARIGNINTFKARSVLAEVCKRFKIPDHERFELVNVLIEYSSGDARFGCGIEDTLNETDVGRRFKEKYPNAVVVTELENHASHTGVHAAGVIVSMEPVSNYCTVGADGVAQIDKHGAEDLGLLKIDALGLRTLGIIEDSGVITQNELYSLKLDDPKVLKIFNDKKFSSVFQFEGPAQRQVSSEVYIDSFKTIDHITALARPGPLGGGASTKYIERKAGRQEITTVHPMLADALKDTYGVVLYQEQVMGIVRNIGKFSWEDATIIRKAMSGRKGREFFNQKGVLFIEGAAKDGISPATAQTIWDEMCDFGAWGMNKSHTCSYAIISYWCAWMKAYHPLEYAAACLRGAKDDEGALAVLREMAMEGINYVPFDVDRSVENWNVIDGILIGGFTNLVGIGPAKAKAALAARAEGRLDREKFLALPVKFSDLYPLKTKYKDLYANPEAYGCSEGSVILTSDQFPESGNVLYIGKITRKRPLDMNDDRRVARRGGKKYEGNTLAIDIMTMDDHGQEFLCRIDHHNWEKVGSPANDALEIGDELLVRGFRVRGFSMINVMRMKCLNKPDLSWQCESRRWGR